MPILNNIEYLSMPQQVEKNKDDIAQLKVDTAKTIYTNTDILPTPAVGEVHTYIVVQTTPSDEGMIGILLGATTIFSTGDALKGGILITVSNVQGSIFLSNSNGWNGQVLNLSTQALNTDYLSLLRLY